MATLCHTVLLLSGVDVAVAMFQLSPRRWTCVRPDRTRIPNRGRISHLHQVKCNKNKKNTHVSKSLCMSGFFACVYMYECVCVHRNIDPLALSTPWSPCSAALPECLLTLTRRALTGMMDSVAMAIEVCVCVCVWGGSYSVSVSPGELTVRKATHCLYSPQQGQGEITPISPALFTCSPEKIRESIWAVKVCP